MLNNLRFGHLGGRGSVVGVHDRAARGAGVGRDIAEVVHGVSHLVNSSAKGGALRTDRAYGQVKDIDGRARSRSGANAI